MGVTSMTSIVPSHRSHLYLYSRASEENQHHGTIAAALVIILIVTIAYYKPIAVLARAMGIIL